MITVYLRRVCDTEKNLKNWLLRNGAQYIEKNVCVHQLTREEIIHILRLTENGVSDIISTRCKAVKLLDIDFEDLKFDELINLIQENPKLLKTPIIVDERHLQIGFNEDAIRQFIPREIRNLSIIKQYKEIKTKHESSS